MTIAKLSRLFIFLLLTCSCTLTWGDDPDENAECEESCTNGIYYYNSFSVQTITLEELQSQINIESALPYGETGKFYFYNNSLFVNEPQLGLHLLDVSNPTNIQKNNFIENCPRSKQRAIERHHPNCKRHKNRWCDRH